MDRIYAKILMAILTALILLQTSYSDENINNYEYLKLKIDNRISFQIEKENDMHINEFRLKSNFLPTTYQNAQYLNDFKSSHNNYNIYNSSKGTYINFNYDENSLKYQNEINNEFILKSTLFRPTIKDKAVYPPGVYDSKYDKYLEFEGLIDTNEKIREKATQLATGEDDIYVISVKSARWIRDHVEYDLSTVTQNPNQKSTQVFTSQQGVCKEVTILFVSMMRSLGIPARIATGYAYTTSDEVVDFVGSNWGGHAWAEVLIDGKWVPFDLTYDQYGYVDAGHIIISQSDNINENSITINASGYGFSLVDNSLKLENLFEITDKDTIFESGYDITISGPKELSPGSYGYLKIGIENLENYYQAVFVRLAKAEEIELLEDPEKLIIFNPNEKKEIYYRYKVPQLDPGYIYTFPFSVYNNNLENSFNLSVKQGYDSIKEDELPKDTTKEPNNSDKNLTLNCSYEYGLPEHSIECSITNSNNYKIEDAKICIIESCKTLDLLINQKKNIKFNTSRNNNTVVLEYEEKREQIELALQKPQISYTHELSGNMLEVRYKILNPLDGITLNIYKNDSLINNSNKVEGSLRTPLDIGTNRFTLKMEYKGKNIGEEEFEILATKKETKEDNILTKIIDSIKDFFARLLGS